MEGNWIGTNLKYKCKSWHFIIIWFTFLITVWKCYYIRNNFRKQKTLDEVNKITFVLAIRILTAPRTNIINQPLFVPNFVSLCFLSDTSNLTVTLKDILKKNETYDSVSFMHVLFCTFFSSCQLALFGYPDWGFPCFFLGCKANARI